tara:strand:- start:4297 stop:6105 length:1809 start_codon:yes stop_codon:yes gene_type:complete
MANKKVNFLITAKDQASKTFRILNNTMKSVKKTVGGITKALGKFTLVTGATATAVALLSKRFMDQIDSIDKVSKKIGVGADFLQKLRFASEITGVEIRTTDMALQRFTRRMAEARIGTGEALPALKELGVSFFDTNGQARDTEDVFFDVARALNEVDDDATKLRLGFKLFDSEGVALVTTMGALIEQFQIFDDLGLGLGDDNIKKVADLKDNLTEVSNIVNLIGMSTFAGLSDEIDSIVTALKTKLIDFIDNDANKFAQDLGEKIKSIVLAVIQGIEFMLNALVSSINKTAQMIQKLSDKFDLGITVFEDSEEVAKKKKEIKEQLDVLNGFFGNRKAKLDIVEQLGLDPEGLAHSIKKAKNILNAELKSLTTNVLLDSFSFSDAYLKLINDTLSIAGMGTGTATQEDDDDLVDKPTAMQKHIQDYAKTIKEISQIDIADSMIDGIKSIEDSFVQLFQGSSQGFKDLANSIKTNFIQFLVQEFITSGLLKLLGSFGLKTGADSFSGRMMDSVFGRANGGTILSGQTAIVGERGAEIITASQDMTVKPANQTADILGNTGGATVNFNITTNDSNGFDELLASRKNLLVGLITQSMNQRGKPGLI